MSRHLPRRSRFFRCLAHVRTGEEVIVEAENSHPGLNGRIPPRVGQCLTRRRCCGSQFGKWACGGNTRSHCSSVSDVSCVGSVSQVTLPKNMVRCTRKYAWVCILSVHACLDPADFLPVKACRRKRCSLCIPEFAGRGWTAATLQNASSPIISQKRETLNWRL